MTKRKIRSSAQHGYSAETDAAQRQSSHQNSRDLVIDEGHSAEMLVLSAPAVAGLGSQLMAIGQQFGSVELDITRDRSPAISASFDNAADAQKT